MFDKLQAILENKRPEKIIRHADQDIGTFLLVEGGKTGAIKFKYGSSNLINEKSRRLPGITFTNKHGNHLVAMLTKYGSQGNACVNGLSPHPAQ
jgi:hypothetical protein